MTVKQWQSMGVAPIEGEEFPASGTQASLIQTGKDGKFYMVYHNWHVLMKWNRSIFFATAAGYLSDRIR
jgi:membrane-bound lytic murein transglycosylase B